MKKSNEFDVIIVGAGIVGLTLACALAEQALRVAIVNNAPLKKQALPEKFDNRVSAITRASENIFTKLSAWSAMTQVRVSPFREMKVWDASGSGYIHFSSKQLSEPYLGHIIENQVMINALLEQCHKHHVKLIAPAIPQQIIVTEAQAILTLDDHSAMVADLIVGADGGNSWVRESQGFPLVTRAYGHTAIVANIKTTEPHDNCARQRFLPSGPLAFLPLAEAHTCSIVWSCVPELAEELMALPENAFLQRLSLAFDHVLGEVIHTSKRVQFPLIMRQAKNTVKPRLALVGDAAHTIHPLAGQGVNLGLLDAACLSEVLCAAKAKNALGKLATLRRYERWRKSHNHLMSATVQGFKELFGSDNTLLTWIRNTGLSLTNQCSPLKTLIMRRAMGLSGDLPALAR
jgi:2-octaprenylphenol hydroxylase